MRENDLMNFNLIKGYLQALLSILILTATAILIVNNIGGEWRMQVFWRPVRLRPAVWLLLAAAGGIIIWYTITRLVPTAIASLRKGKKSQREKANHRKVMELEKRKDEVG